MRIRAEEERRGGRKEGTGEGDRGSWGPKGFSRHFNEEKRKLRIAPSWEQNTFQHPGTTAGLPQSGAERGRTHVGRRPGTKAAGLTSRFPRPLHTRAFSSCHHLCGLDATTFILKLWKPKLGSSTKVLVSCHRSAVTTLRRGGREGPWLVAVLASPTPTLSPPFPSHVPSTHLEHCPLFGNFH